MTCERAGLAPALSFSLLHLARGEALRHPQREVRVLDCRMRTARTPRALAWVMVAALVSLGAAILEESFVHTDDGCAVEIHCLACRLAAGSTVVIAATAAPPAVPAPAGTVSPDAAALVAETCPVLRPSRAPPLG